MFSLDGQWIKIIALHLTHLPKIPLVSKIHSCLFASLPLGISRRVLVGGQLSVTASDLFLFDSSPISTCTLRHWAFSCSAPQSLDLWAIFSGCKRRNLDHQHCYLLMSAIGLGIFKLQKNRFLHFTMCLT